MKGGIMLKIRQRFHKIAHNRRFASVMLLLPYLIGFILIVVLPIIVATALSFTNFNAVSAPKFIGLSNYIALFTQDQVFMQYILPNTVKFSLIAGPVGFILSFFLAWMLAQIPRRSRTVLAMVLYSPSMVTGATMTVIWRMLFSGDSTGFINSYLISWGWVDKPIQFLQSPDYLMYVVIGVTIWGSMGIGFLAMLAGVLNIDQELYEAAYIDGVKSRFREIINVTIPSMKPQMLFGAVMAVLNTFSAGTVGVDLSGSNPTPRYSAQMFVNHIDDFGFIRYEMGYATAIAVVLLLIIWLTSKLVFKLFAPKAEVK